MAIGAAVLSSCSDDDNIAVSNLEVWLTDAPIDGLDSVVVDIQQVRVKFSGDSTDDSGWQNLSTNSGTYDLLSLQNGVDTSIATGSFSSGTVKQMRFVLGNNNYVVDTLGNKHALTIPSGGTSGLKIMLHKPLDEPNETILIDFDAALSIHEQNGSYKLVPVLQVK